MHRKVQTWLILFLHAEMVDGTGKVTVRYSQRAKSWMNAEDFALTGDYQVLFLPSTPKVLE